MTTPRPTDEQIGLTLTKLYVVATNDTDAYLLIDHLIDHYHWLLGEITKSEEGRAFGHGASEVHIFGSGSGDLEGRLFDPLLREQRKVKRRWLTALRHTGHRWADDANDITKIADRYQTG